MARPQLNAFLAAVLLFACGVAVGVSAQRYLQHASVRAANSDDWRAKYIDEMRTRVHLDSRQVGQLDLILDETRRQSRELHERNKPELLEIKQGQIARVKAILSADQIQQYEKLLAEREQRQKEQDDRELREERNRAEAAHQSTK
jgi:hypothetical protein